MQPRIFPAASADAALEDHYNQARKPDDNLKPARKLVRHRGVLSNKKPAIRGGSPERTCRRARQTGASKVSYRIMLEIGTQSVLWSIIPREAENCRFRQGYPFVNLPNRRIDPCAHPARA